MSTQSTLDQIKAARISRANLIGLLAGIVIGLVFGLLIGWVWWPVEWQGTTFNDLPAEAKAAYMGAVADAYVAYSSPEAAAIAAERLAPVPGDLSENFNEVIAYYAAQPDSGVQVSNLVLLAAAIGAPIALQENEAITGTGDTSAPAAAAATTATTGGGQGSSLGGWLAVVVLALLLIGGGLYILWRIAQQRELNEVDSGTGAFTDEPIPPGTPVAATFERDSLPPPARTPNAGYAQASAGSSAAASAPRAQPVTSSYAFEEEDEDEPPPPGTTAAVAGYVRTEAWRSNFYDQNPPSAPEIDAEGVEDEDLGDENLVDETAENQPELPAAGTAVAPPKDNGQEMPPALPPPNPALARYDRYTTLDSYTATYQVGITDFDRTRNVQNPAGEGYVGEYGIGISERNGLLNNNLEQVIALEVYLFDKTEEAQMTTVTRPLLSEYAHDKLYKSFEREKSGVNPIIAQPNTRFQLEGKHLVLDCLVKEVRYTREGIFQMVSVEMVLKRKS